MRSLVLLFIPLLVLAARLLKSDGAKSVIAENLILKQQLIVLSRSRHKAPNLKTSDRLILGGLSLFLAAHRRLLTAVIVKPSTLLRFNRALVDRKYSRCSRTRVTSGQVQKAHHKNLSMPPWNSSGETQDSFVHESLTQYVSLLASRSRKISCGIFLRSITGVTQIAAVYSKRRL